VNRINKLAQRTDPSTSALFHHHWIGDVANWFYVVADQYRLPVPQKGGRLPDHKRKEMERYVEELNANLLHSNPAKVFPDVCKNGAVLAVAGGNHKLSSIYQVLRQDPQWISHLVTDSEVALALISDRVPGR
jgi:hypothetical protein